MDTFNEHITQLGMGSWEFTCPYSHTTTKEFLLAGGCHNRMEGHEEVGDLSVVKRRDVGQVKPLNQRARR